MNTPAQHIVLNEVDAELTLLGSLFAEPGAFEKHEGEIAPEWFSDQFLRYLFESAKKITAEGNRISGQAIIGRMPEDCGGLSRTALYAAAMRAALPVAMLGGIMATVKDRWARRALMDAANLMGNAATRFDADPYDVASDAVLALDTINAARRGREGNGSVQAATGALADGIAHPETKRGPTTGLRALDAKLSGYVPGQLYVIAGRPGMGKSAFMCSSLLRTAFTGHGVGIISLEMTGAEVAARMIADLMDNPAGPTFGEILRGELSESYKAEVLRHIDTLNELPLQIETDSRLTFSEIAGRARQLKAKLEAQGRFLSVLCIDHMGLVTPSDRYRGNKVAEAGEVSGAARALAKELDCCVILLCQLSREVEKRDDKKPNMADLRWSGEIEQDAHVIGFLYRAHYYLNSDPNADPYALSAAKNSLDFLIRKNRQGETADVSLWCSIGHSMVRDWQ
jgi:replicative DNA helicase